MKRGLILYPKSTTNNSNTAYDWLKQEALCFGIHLDLHFFEYVPLVYDSNYHFTISVKEMASVAFFVIRGYHELLSFPFYFSYIAIA